MASHTHTRTLIPFYAPTLFSTLRIPIKITVSSGSKISFSTVSSRQCERRGCRLTAGGKIIVLKGDRHSLIQQIRVHIPHKFCFPTDAAARVFTTGFRHRLAGTYQSVTHALCMHRFRPISLFLSPRSKVLRPSSNTP